MEFINSLYPTIKFTLVHSPTSLDVLDLTLSLVDGYIQTEIYSKPTDNHIYLLRNSAHPGHCSKAIPFGVATRVRRNCSSSEAFEKRSIEYQSYLINRGYNPSQVKLQFEKVKSIPRENLLVLNTKQSKKVFPLVLDYNPSLFRKSQNIKEILARPRPTTHTDIQGCFKCKGKCNLCRSRYVFSDPSDSDSIELPTPLLITIFDLHWIVMFLALPIPTPLPIPSLV